MNANKMNSGDVLGIVMLVISVVLYSMSDLLVSQHLFFWGTAVMSGITFLVSRPWVNDEWLITGIYFLALSILWYLPISPYWGLTPMIIIGWIHAELAGLKGGILLSFAVALFVATILTINIIDAKKEDFLTSATPETVVITHVDKISKDDIRVFIEGKGTLLFDDSKETEDAWKLNNGDTVQIVVYEHKIVKLIY